MGKCSSCLLVKRFPSWETSGEFSVSPKALAATPVGAGASAKRAPGRPSPFTFQAWLIPFGFARGPRISLPSTRSSSPGATSPRSPSLPASSSIWAPTSAALRFSSPITTPRPASWNTDTHVALTDPQAPNSHFQASANSPSANIPAYSIPALLQRQKQSPIDLLKIDVEGAARDLPTHQPQAWLDRVGVLMIELHDRLRPGCSRALHDALQPYAYRQDVAHETIIVTRL